MLGRREEEGGEGRRDEDVAGREEEWNEGMREKKEATLPRTRTYVCNAEVGRREGDWDGWVEEIIDLGSPEVVLQVESGL